MKKHKLPIILMSVIAVLFVTMKGYQTYQLNELKKQPTAGIECAFVGSVVPSAEISRSMFQVNAITQSGLKYRVSDFQIDEKKAPETGGTFDVTVTYGEFQKTVSVPVNRSKIVEYSIGYPKQDDVLATVYANGDLEFSGKGNTLKFTGNKTPWFEEEYKNVYFLDGVEPVNIDYWFYEGRTLESCNDLPKTIESMYGTFAGCEVLESTPDFFQCENLRIMTAAFERCYSLKKTDVIPVNVSNADYAYSECVNLTEMPDLSKNNSLTSINAMFNGCASLVSLTEIPESVEQMNQTFQGCTNIRSAVKFPKHTEYASYTYADCTSLQKAATIPAAVLDYSYCYAGCTDLYGDLKINSETQNIDNVLYNSASSGRKLYLDGNSPYLITIQQSYGNKSILLKDPEKAEKNAEKVQVQ